MRIQRGHKTESTPKEKSLAPYWNESSLEKNLSLWLPTRMGLQDSNSVLSDFWLNDHVEKSWFSTTLFNDSFQNQESELTKDLF
jgi:hypothetical protein